MPYSSISLTIDLNGVLRAVVSCAPDAWYSIGTELGFTSGELMSMTEGLCSHAAKLQRIVHQKAAAVGEEDATQLLLQACRNIPNPVIGDVLRKLQTQK